MGLLLPEVSSAARAGCALAHSEIEAPASDVGTLLGNDLAGAEVSASSGEQRLVPGHVVQSA